MQYAQLKTDGSFNYQITTDQPIEWDSKNFCTAAALIKDGKGPLFHVAELHEVDPPAYNRFTEVAVRDGAVWRNERWEYNWRIDAMPAERRAANLAAKVEALWQAADRYVSGYISGVAIGILTVGVLQGKPKAQAVTLWSSSVWGEYYRRKALITLESVDNLDFSSFGAMPHTVPELQAEVGL